MDRLSTNLNEFGVVDPIIIDLKDNNTIIGGHQRYKALQKKHKASDEFFLITLGDIGWVFESDNLKIKDKEHQKALNVSLNKIQGTWDRTKLSELLSDLNSASFNMDLTGFDEIELATFNTEDNIFFNEGLFDLEEEYTPPTKEPSPSQDDEDPEENFESEYTSSDYDSESSSEYTSYFLELVFKTEDEMDEAYEKLSKEGYEVRR